MLEAQPPARAGPAGQDLVGHQQDLPLVAEPAELGEEIVGRHDRPAPALDRLQDEPGDVVDRRPVDVLAVEIEVLVGVDRPVGLRPERAIRVRPGHQVHSRRPDAAVDRRTDLRQRHRAVGLAVEIVEAGDHLVPAGRRPQDAHARLDRRRAAVVELEAVEVAGEDLGEFLQQLRLDGRREIVGVHQLPRLPGDRLADLRVAVAEGGDVDARREIEVAVAVDVGQHAAVAALEGHREELHLAREAFVQPAAAVVPLFRARPRRRHLDIGHRRSGPTSGPAGRCRGFRHSRLIRQ